MKVARASRVLIRAWVWVLIPFLIPVKSFADMSLVERLTHLGFKCRHQENGNVCLVDRVHEKVGNSRLDYSQPVAILVPDGVTEQPKDMILYLHGFRGLCGVENSTRPEAMVNQFHFLNQLKAARATNSVMVFPMSRGECDTYKQEFVGQFRQFTEWAEQMVDPVDDHWILAGHSGAGSILANSLGRNPEFARRVDGAILLDATYGMEAHNSQWAAASRTNTALKILSVHTGGDTGDGSNSLRASVGNRVVMSRASREVEHCDVPNQFGELLVEARSGIRQPPLSPRSPPVVSISTQTTHEPTSAPTSVAPRALALPRPAAVDSGVPHGMTGFFDPFAPPPASR